MPKRKEKKINIKTKKPKKITIKKTTPEKTTAPSVWNPRDIMETMDRWFWEDPWTRPWQRRWWSLLPREMYEHRLEPDIKHTNVDLLDTGKEYKVIAEMPGVNKRDLEVSITPNDISICGETKTETKKEEEGYLRRERSYSTLCRTMAFPEEVNPEKAEATLKDGILEVKVTKRTPKSGRRTIPVK
jgi:HSP20 family protein